MKELFTLALAATLAGCAGAPERPALALRGIMHDMAREAAAIAEGLMHEDYARVEAAAQAVAAAAGRRDARAALAAFHDMQSACNACHAEFRRPLLEKFYGPKGAARSS